MLCVICAVLHLICAIPHLNCAILHVEYAILHSILAILHLISVIQYLYVVWHLGVNINFFAVGRSHGLSAQPIPGHVESGC